MGLLLKEIQTHWPENSLMYAEQCVMADKIMTSVLIYPLKPTSIFRHMNQSIIDKSLRLKL